MPSKVHPLIPEAQDLLRKGQMSRPRFHPRRDLARGFRRRRVCAGCLRRTPAPAPAAAHPGARCNGRRRGYRCTYSGPQGGAGSRRRRHRPRERSNARAIPRSSRWSASRIPGATSSTI